MSPLIVYQRHQADGIGDAQAGNLQLRNLFMNF